ncbi:MAG: ribosome small subunit-dependent GTPase A [Bacteroidales bacterium]|nr:ribosome small subunit-dependent GTPase A [Bacteroidales bacterium]
MRGLIVSSTGDRYEVWKEPSAGESGSASNVAASVVPSGEPQVFVCRVKGNFRLKGIKTTNPVAVGDHVRFEWDAQRRTGWITSVEERKNVLIRKSVNLSKRTHIIAANIDRAFCVVSLREPYTPPGFIDRFTVACEAYHLPCAIIFNKIDLYDATAETDLAERMAVYERIGYPCFRTSAVTGEGVEALKSAMQGRVCLFSGNSGVGKSALANAVEPGLNLREGRISETHLKGMHTTTFARMYRLTFGAFLIDTPGIKELGMVNLNTEEISRYFPEMRALADRCRFNNCTHEHEPGCAVKQAVSEGGIAAVRYKNYLNILHGDEVEEPGLLQNKQEGRK